MNKFGTAVILAGGKSQRMGFDKQHLKLNKVRLIDKQINRLSLQFNEILIVSNTPEIYSESDARAVKDRIPAKGPLSGIHAGLSEAKCNFVYFLACDMPNICIDYIRYMQNEIINSQYDGCVTRTHSWIEPFNAFYSKNILGEIETDLMNDKGSIFYLIDKLNFRFIEEHRARKINPDLSMFLNLNTKNDVITYLSCYID